jgi:hypothetical protein
MIDIIFNRANEVVIVKIDGNSLWFGNTVFGNKLATIDGLRLDFNGTIREFPDLANDVEWNKKAIERFKEHIRELETEDAKADYVISELNSKGYNAKWKQKAGFRPVRL